MQKLKLAEDIFDQLRIRKRTTIRLGKRDITHGDLLFESNDLKRELIVNVVTVSFCQLKNVPVKDLLNDGFDNPEHMFNEMKRFYPEIEMESWVTVIGFDI